MDGSGDTDTEGQELEGVALQLLSSMMREPMARRAAPEREARAGEHLPYAAHIDDFTIEMRNGMLLQFIELAGLPFETAESEEVDYRKALRESGFRAIASSRFALYQHVIRREVAPLLAGKF